VQTIPPAWVPTTDGTLGRIAFGQLDAGTPGQTPDSAHEYKAWAHVANEQNELRRLRTYDGDASTTPPPPTPPDKWVRRDGQSDQRWDVLLGHLNNRPDTRRAVR